MCSSMEGISRAPYASVQSVSSTRKRKGFYEINLDKWSGMSNHGSGIDRYKPKAADVLLISDTRPANQSVILRLSESCVIVWVSKVYSENKLTVKASQWMETGNHGDERVQRVVNKYDKMLMLWRSPGTCYIKKQWLQNQATLLYTITCGKTTSCEEQGSAKTKWDEMGNSSRRWSFYALYLTNMVTYDRV
jgi:hypothetical protein